MRILLTNDDGLRAPGIEALHQAVMDPRGLFGGPITFPGGDPRDTTALAVAPLTVQSATSHGVTFHQPLMVTEVQVTPDMAGIAVDGRPADCVKLAISSLWPERFGSNLDGTPSRPDLLISGINAGANCGVNVIYSGTVAAAIEGAFLGVPSIAISLRLGSGRPRFDEATRMARRVLDLILARGPLSRHDCLSVNLPLAEDPWNGAGRPEGSLRRARTEQVGTPAPPGEAPVRVCPMNVHGLVDSYERRLSPSGDVYYWAAGHGLDFHGTEPGSDVDLLMRGFITVTPLKYDLTSPDALRGWKDRLEGGGVTEG